MITIQIITTDDVQVQIAKIDPPPAPPNQKGSREKPVHELLPCSVPARKPMQFGS